MGVLSPVANVPGWLPVLTVVASKNHNGRAKPTGRAEGRQLRNTWTLGSGSPQDFEVDESSSQLPRLTVGELEGAFGMDRSRILNEAGRDKESGEGKGIQ